MSFSEFGYGRDAFIIVFKDLQFADAGLGIDQFSVEELGGLVSKAFGDVGRGVEVFAIPFRALSFIDVGCGSDGFLVLVDKEFAAYAGGIDVFFVKRVVNAKLPAVIGMALDGQIVLLLKRNIELEIEL